VPHDASRVQREPDDEVERSGAAKAKPERSASPERRDADAHCGSCNTRNDNDFVELSPGIRLAGYGVDTVSFAWRPTDPVFWDAIERAEQLQMLAGFDVELSQVTDWSDLVRAGSGSWLTTQKVAGAKWGWWRDHGLIYCEGHLATMPRPAVQIPPTKLELPSSLPAAAYMTAFCFDQLLYPAFLPADVTVRRLDMAADLAFDDPGLGLRFLLALSCLDVPAGLKTSVWKERSRVQTIYYRLPAGKIRFRIYDKAAESKQGEPGSLLRLERQIRWPKAAQPSPRDVLNQDLAALWLGELRPWAEAGANVTVGDLTEAQSAVLAAVDDGTLSPFSGERLLGQLVLRARGHGRDWWAKHGKGHISARRDAELRELGVSLAASAEGEPAARLPLGHILASVRDVW
jgi:hypothetical protein